MDLRGLITVEELAALFDIYLVSAEELLNGTIEFEPEELIKIGRWLERQNK